MFFARGGWDDLARRFDALKPGPVVDEGGKVLARHEGLHNFTIGQRRGLGVALGQKAYVVSWTRKALRSRWVRKRVYIQGGLLAIEPHWYLEPEGISGLKVKIRYAHPGVACGVSGSDEGIRLISPNPKRRWPRGNWRFFIVTI